MTNLFLSGGDVIEDIGTHLNSHLKEIPSNNVPSPDTVLRGLKELSTQNTVYESKARLSYNFNINNKFNLLNIKYLLLTKQLKITKSYFKEEIKKANANPLI